MALEVTFISGEPIMVPHTPSSAVAAGQVVVTSATPRICHRPIAANAVGALAAEGGTYKCAKEAGSGKTIGADVLVYWDDTNNRVTTTATGNKRFGYTIEAGTASATTILVRHSPA